VRAVVQRVRAAQVAVGGEVVGAIGVGLAVLLGVHVNDGESEVQYLCDKIARLRIFEDEEGKMNLSVKEVKGSVLLISQFTLYGDARKGRRPSFTEAAPPDRANGLYQKAVERLTAEGLEVQTGRFGAEMVVALENDGPVTLLLDSSRTF
jgi:D-tyrosyl-tRNA(Tyr) deacylase